MTTEQLETRHRLTPYLLVDQKGPKRFFIKEPYNNGLVREPTKEYEWYKLLSPHLNMPKVRLFRGIDQPTRLVVAEAPGIQAADFFNRNAGGLLKGQTENFCDDLVTMWAKTAKPRPSVEPSLDVYNGSKNALQAVLDNLDHLADKSLKINGFCYPSLRTTAGRVKDNLQFEDPYVVLTHGDEHFGNLFITTSSPYRYTVIDPAYSGYSTPARAVNTLLGSTDVFYYHYDHTVSETADQLKIDYQVQQTTTLNAVHDPFNDLRHALGYFGSKSLPALMFVNIARAAIGRIGRPGDTSYVTDKGLMWLGVASQAYYDQGN